MLFMLVIALLGLYVFFWIGTTCIIVVEFARQFSTRTLYLALITLFLLLGLTWCSNSPAWCLGGVCASCFVLPAVRLWLHLSFASEGYELRGDRGYKFLVYGSTIPICTVFTLIFISLLFIAMKT